ncbi:MAG: hypothetical protein IPK69_04370 [Phycisphaerales bacterium]|nr:MAG: hypothetical protein IPK69_04370 [Phycisphaerales bacterium]
MSESRGASTDPTFSDCFEGPHQGREIVDAEGVVSIDHGELRIRPLAKPGFGRAGVRYGDTPTSPRTLVYASILNGHNTSQTYRLKNLARQVYRFTKGSGSTPHALHVLYWLFHQSRESFVRRLWCWAWARFAPPDPVIKDNLSFGVRRPGSSSVTPDADFLGLVMHAASHDCGELHAIGATRTRLLRGVQNVPFHVAIVLREREAIVLFGGVPGARSHGPGPGLMPIAVVDRPAWLGDQATLELQQAVLGEIGFSVDTRVCEIGAMADSQDKMGSSDTHAGLILVRTRRDVDTLSVFVRAGALELRVGPTSVAWVRHEHGHEVTLCEDSRSLRLANGSRLVIVDDGTHMGASLDGVPVMGEFANDQIRLSDHAAPQGGAPLVRVVTGDGTTLEARSNTTTSEGFEIEVFPRSVTPVTTGSTTSNARSATGMTTGTTAMKSTGHSTESFAPFVLPKDSRVVLDEMFPDAGDSAGTLDTLSNALGTWQRTLGHGVIERIAGGGARVRAAVGSPCPNRTLYTLPWRDPSYAALRVEMTPPGSGRGEGHDGRSGVVFEQDAKNSIIVNLWLNDGYEGASISTFFVVDGFDDIYSAVWTNVGDRVSWGKRFALDVTIDGELIFITLNDEPVLWRRMSDVYPKRGPLRIHRVGLASNWEWGLDTGTIFHSFTARMRATT